MNLRSNVVKYEELLRRADGAMTFLENIGLKKLAFGGRMQIYIDISNDLNVALRNEMLDKHFEKYGYDKSGFALKELYELVTIIEHIGELFGRAVEDDRRQILSRLRHVLRGPAFTIDEKPTNSMARNYQHELLVATRFLIQGYSDVVLGDNPDVSVTTGGRRYGIECKRIIGDFDSLSRRRVSEAIRQLDNHKEDFYGGLIALDLSQKYEQGKNWIEGNNRVGVERLALDSLQEDLSSIYRRYPKLTQAADRGLVVGVLASYSGVYIVKKENSMGWIHEISAMAMTEVGEKMNVMLKDFRKLSHYSS